MTEIMLNKSDVFRLVHTAKHPAHTLYPLSNHMQRECLELIRLMSEKVERECGMSLEQFVFPSYPLIDGNPPEPADIDWDSVYVDSVKQENDHD